MEVTGEEVDILAAWASTAYLGRQMTLLDMYEDSRIAKAWNKSRSLQSTLCDKFRSVKLRFKLSNAVERQLDGDSGHEKETEVDTEEDADAPTLMKMFVLRARSSVSGNRIAKQWIDRIKAGHVTDKQGV